MIHELDAELHEAGEIAQPFMPAKKSRAFEPFYESLIVNHQAINREITEYQKPSFSTCYQVISGIYLVLLKNYLIGRGVGYEVNYVSSSNVVNNKNNLKIILKMLTRPGKPSRVCHNYWRR